MFLPMLSGWPRVLGQKVSIIQRPHFVESKNHTAAFAIPYAYLELVKNLLTRTGVGFPSHICCQTARRHLYEVAILCNVAGIASLFRHAILLAEACLQASKTVESRQCLHSRLLGSRPFPDLPIALAQEGSVSAVTKGAPHAETLRDPTAQDLNCQGA